PEALPNLINPYNKLPLLGLLGLKARDLIGFTFVQLLVHIPLVLVLHWALGSTQAYIPPVMPKRIAPPDNFLSLQGGG
ncbi:hypothetical protein ACPTK3_30745, partial [Pseudomonas aeruginosa]